MQGKPLFLLLLPLLISLSEFSQSQAPPLPPFGHFILALQYEPSAVSRFPYPPCRVERLTIHGLWPSSSRGKLVENCRTDYNEDEVKKLFSQLYMVWPDQERGDHYGFWKTQWLKHGTCSGLTEHDYFSQAIQLYTKNNVPSVLLKAPIFPGQFYTPKQILQKYETGRGAEAEDPMIVCSGNRITEFRLNFSTTFGPQPILSYKQINDCNGLITLPKGSPTFRSNGSTLT